MVIRLPKYYNSRLRVTIHNSIINIRENIRNALKQLYQNASCTNLAINMSLWLNIKKAEENNQIDGGVCFLQWLSMVIFWHHLAFEWFQDGA